MAPKKIYTEEFRDHGEGYNKNRYTIVPAPLGNEPNTNKY